MTSKTIDPITHLTTTSDDILLDKNRADYLASDILPIQVSMENLDQPLMESPLLLQALYDDEVTEDHHKAVQEAFKEDPRMLALKEMTALLKFDSEQHLEDYDPNALFNSISRAIAKDKFQTAQNSNVPPIKPAAEQQIIENKIQNIAQDSDQNSKSNENKTIRFFDYFKRPHIWIPLLACAAALLLVLPLHFQNTQDSGMPNEPEQVIVFMGMNANNNPGNVSRTASNAPIIWYTGTTPNPASAANTTATAHAAQIVEQLPLSTLARLTSLTNPPNEQLTVEQLNTAISLLITRIEALEKEKTQNNMRSYPLILGNNPDSLPINNNL